MPAPDSGNESVEAIAMVSKETVEITSKPLEAVGNIARRVSSTITLARSFGSIGRLSDTIMGVGNVPPDAPKRTNRSPSCPAAFTTSKPPTPSQPGKPKLAQLVVKVNKFGLGVGLKDEKSLKNPAESVVKVVSFGCLPVASAALEAGVQINDEVVMVNGVKIASSSHMERVVKGLKFGDAVLIKIKKGDAPATKPAVTLRTGRPSNDKPAAPRLSSQASVIPPSKILRNNSNGTTTTTTSNSDTFDLLGLGGDGGGPAVASASPSPLPSAPVMPSSTATTEDDNLMEDFGQRKGWDPVVDIKHDIDFLNLLGVTRYKYCSMTEDEKQKVRKGVGLE